MTRPSTEDQSIATYYKFARSHPWQGHDIEANVLGIFWNVCGPCREKPKPAFRSSIIINHPDVTAAGHAEDGKMAAVRSGDSIGLPRASLVPQRGGVAL